VDDKQPVGGPGTFRYLSGRVGKFAAAAIVALGTTVAAQSPDEMSLDELSAMSLDDLMNLAITSVSKKPQKKSEAAAAIFVITNNDLERWGVTSIPDALRRVPGLQVARFDANKWAITARGFNSRFANKLLVLIDGRSVYTPLFAGVYWEANDVMLEDVERIEVIRGPGGALWGANAVNGVINIVTKSAADTAGTLIAMGSGNEERGFGSIRHGGDTGGGKHYRVYGKFRGIDAGDPVQVGMLPPAAHDDSNLAQAGFRMDWGDETNTFTAQADYHAGKGGQQLLIATSPVPVVEDAEYSGANLTGRWTHKTDADSELVLQAYYDHVSRESTALFEDRHTLDLDFQHHFSLKGGHDIVWGLNYRSIRDDTEPTPIFDLSPRDRGVNLFGAFLQDEISRKDGRLKLTLGAKLEHNDFTGFEAQPSVRYAWVTESGDTLWAAVSRAVRTPARGEHDVALAVIPPPPAPPPLVISGSDSFKSETLTAYEIGYRFTPTNAVSLDLAAFYNDYDDLRTVDVSTPLPPLAASFGNNMKGSARGVEIDTHWRAADRLAVHANYSWLVVALDRINGSMDVISESNEDASPRHQANVWLAGNLGSRVEVDAGLRYVGELETFGFPKTDSYVAFDVRVGYSPRKGLDLALIGSNLFGSAHREFNPDFIFSVPTAVQRSLHGKVTLSF